MSEQQSDAQKRFGEAWINAAAYGAGFAGGLFLGVGAAPALISWTFGYVAYRITNSQPLSMIEGVMVGGVAGALLYLAGSRAHDLMLVANSFPVLATGYLLAFVLLYHVNRCWRQLKLES